ncbi:hypothetical protein EYZ11_001865 [Aspergillus tanneri]|nr:hypothetical protein EYZ11_001865 [Aspergillus tanneri]
MQKSPRRWSSIQGAPPSPHDTEPNSSILSAKAARSRSDNVNADEILQSLSVDERSLPVAIEIPPVGKKRGRPKKSLPDNDEENELAQPVGNQIVDQPSIPEKRRPGRPPKNQKMAETSVDRISQITHPDDTLPLPKQTDDETLNTAENNASQPPIQHSAPEPKATNISAENHDNKTNPLTNPTKDSKKKKLKRGKTTSVVLKKTYESDVEDDVIWVDERPSPTTLQDVTSAPFSVNIEIANPSPSHANVSDETRQDDENMMNPSNTIQQSEQAPKKRGRKRKKTSDQPQPIAEQPDNPPSYQHEESSHLNTDAHNPFSLDNHTTNIEANNTLPAQITSPEEQNTSSHSESPPKQTSISNAPMTPSKPPPGTPLQSSTDPNPDITTKGPDKHSPISSTSKVPYRVGLSRRARISPLLKIVRR